MKQQTTFFILLMLLGYGLKAQIQPSSFYKQLFFQQLTETCRPNLRWEKSVTDISAGTPMQTKIFDLDCFKGSKTCEGKVSSIEAEEFEPLFRYVFDNPKQKDNLQVSETSDKGMTAKPKAGLEADAELKLQSFDILDGKMQFAEAIIEKSTALYDLYIHIEVKFDAAGHYQSHTVHTKTSALMGGDVEAKIEGRLLN